MPMLYCRLSDSANSELPMAMRMVMCSYSAEACRFGPLPFRPTSYPDYLVVSANLPGRFGQPAWSFRPTDFFHSLLQALA